MSNPATKEQEMASWAENALDAISIPGKEAKNLITVQMWLGKIAAGELVVTESSEGQ